MFRTRRQVPCEMFISRKCSKDLVEKIVSSVKFDTNPSFKQCFFFNQLIVYQSFYGGLLVFSYFLLQEKALNCFACVGRSHVTFEMFISKAFQRPCRKNYISGYVLHKSFIQTIEWSFLNEIFIYQSFYGGLLMFSYFLLQRKFVSAHVGEMFVLKMSKKLKLFAACMFLRHLLRMHYFWAVLQ